MITHTLAPQAIQQISIRILGYSESSSSPESRAEDKSFRVLFIARYKGDRVMVRGFGYCPREFAMDEILSSDSGKQASLSAELSSLPPLNLTLRKTPSFLNLLKSKLLKNDNSASQRAPEKLKASNFPASLLRIGSWQEVSRNEADLVAKCYYSKKKLVWEVLKNGLKSKIEIQWSDISAIRATLREDQPGILEIELDQAPTFYQESNPQPRKHTIWHMTTDFTGGQASLHRRHYIKFPPGVLDRHYEKLLQNDQRLLELSRKAFPSHGSPYFNWAPYEYHLTYSFDRPAHELEPQIDFRTTDPRQRFVPPHGSIHQPVQALLRPLEPAISGPSRLEDNMVVELSSSSDDRIPGFCFGETGTTHSAEDLTFYMATTMAATEMNTVDMGMPSSFQQNEFNYPVHYSYGVELDPARSFHDASYGYDGTDFTAGDALQLAESSLPCQFNDGHFMGHSFGNVFTYPTFSHGY